MKIAIFVSGFLLRNVSPKNHLIQRKLPGNIAPFTAAHLNEIKKMPSDCAICLRTGICYQYSFFIVVIATEVP
jgi:hypothetical protein